MVEVSRIQDSSEVAPKNFRDTLLEEPSFNNTLPQQTCPQCGKLDSEMVSSERAINIYYCHHCNLRFQWQQSVGYGGMAISQPKRPTGRGVGEPQSGLPPQVPDPVRSDGAIYG